MKKNILIVSPTPTHPPHAGNKAYILSYANYLQTIGYNVYFLLIADFKLSQDIIKQTREYWGDHLFIYKKKRLHRIKDIFFRIINFRWKGYCKIDDLYPIGSGSFLRRITKRFDIGTVMLNYVYLTKILKKLDPDVKKILVTHDVFTNKYQRTGSRWYSLTPNEESKGLNRADLILAIQEEEAIFYRYITRLPVLTSFGYFKQKSTPFCNNRKILYLAGPNEYNISAIRHFIEYIYPEIITCLEGNVELLIGGKICSVIKDFCNNKNIILQGEVNSLDSFYSQGDIVINPTFQGTGLKIKTFEALAYGKIVISHPHGVEGIYKKENSPIFIADKAADYCNVLLRLFQDNSFALKRKYMSETYISQMNENFETILKNAITFI